MSCRHYQHCRSRVDRSGASLEQGRHLFFVFSEADSPREPPCTVKGLLELPLTSRYLVRRTNQPEPGLLVIPLPRSTGEFAQRHLGGREIPGPHLWTGPPDACPFSALAQESAVEFPDYPHDRQAPSFVQCSPASGMCSGGPVFVALVEALAMCAVEAHLYSKPASTDAHWSHAGFSGNRRFALNRFERAGSGAWDVSFFVASGCGGDESRPNLPRHFHAGFAHRGCTLVAQTTYVETMPRVGDVRRMTPQDLSLLGAPRAEERLEKAAELTGRELSPDGLIRAESDRVRGGETSPAQPLFKVAPAWWRIMTLTSEEPVTGRRSFLSVPKPLARGFFRALHMGADLPGSEFVLYLGRSDAGRAEGLRSYVAAAAPHPEARGERTVEVFEATPPPERTFEPPLEVVALGEEEAAAPLQRVRLSFPFSDCDSQLRHCLPLHRIVRAPESPGGWIRETVPPPSPPYRLLPGTRLLVPQDGAGQVATLISSHPPYRTCVMGQTNPLCTSQTLKNCMSHLTRLALSGAPFSAARQELLKAWSLNKRVRELLRDSAAGQGSRKSRYKELAQNLLLALAEADFVENQYQQPVWPADDSDDDSDEGFEAIPLEDAVMYETGLSDEE